MDEEIFNKADRLVKKLNIKELVESDLLNGTLIDYLVPEFYPVPLIF